MNKHKFILLFIFLSSLFSYQNSSLMSNEPYITGQDGVIRMYVNIMGHVKNPGTYLVYDNIDFLSALALAGGYLQGSDLKNVKLYSIDGENKNINLNNLESINNLIKLKPHDTVFIEEKRMSKFFLSSNLPYIIISLLNLAVTLDKN
tara:strand:+ start:1001 stop:1441 length:441 start_codon:yes stop_codon:yes gene_type:complete